MRAGPGFLPKCDALETLQVGSSQRCQFRRGSGLRHIAHLSSLRDLNLCNSGITDSDFEPLEALAGLRRLNISGTRITDKTLKRLSAFTKLEDLSIYDTDITADGVLSLANVPSLRHVNMPDSIPAKARSALRKALPQADIFPEP